MHPLRDLYVGELRTTGYAAAAETMLRDWADFVRFYHYPKEHWIHLRTSNPVESLFAEVRLRTNAAKRMRKRSAALYPPPVHFPFRGCVFALEGYAFP